MAVPSPPAIGLLDHLMPMHASEGPLEVGKTAKNYDIILEEKRRYLTTSSCLAYGVGIYKLFSGSFISKLINFYYNRSASGS